MDELDKKLLQTLRSFTWRDGSGKIDADSALASVKQVFIDNGWKHDGFTTAVESVYKNISKGNPPIWVDYPLMVRIAGVDFMTGQEWYDRFKKEMGSAADYCEGCSCDAIEAAKKASGIE